MRSVTPIVAFLLACATSAFGGKNQHGAMIVHTVDAYEYSSPAACMAAEADPGSCEEANTTATRAQGQVIWMLAAFPVTADPGVVVVYFGIVYDDPGLDIAAHTLCGPAGSLEIPDTAWPASGTGNSVAFGSPVAHDTLFPFYVFAVDGGIEGASSFCSSANPTGGYGAFVDDSDPPQMDECLNFGCVRWGEPGENHCPGIPPRVGACCIANGSCRVLPPEACAVVHGTYLGDDVPCEPNPCPQPGACCFPDGTCDFTQEADCDGTFLGGPCHPNPCPQPPPYGACCYPDGHCAYVLEAECPTGSWTADRPCNPSPCPQPGACCHDDGSCTLVLQEDCSTGMYYPETPCDPNPCTQPQACCFELGTCRMLFDAYCIRIGGSAQGEGSVCEPSPCPPAGTPRACCLPDHSCAVLDAGSCVDRGGDPRMPGVGCDPDPCSVPEVPHACCFGDESCRVLSHEECLDAGGLPQGACTLCDPNPCVPSPPGACCYDDGTCDYTTEDSCPTGDFRWYTPCDPNPCLQCRSAGRFIPIPPEASRGAAIDTPIPYAPPSGVGEAIGSSRDVCWSEPADLGDAKLSSEVIGAYGLESKIANDFLIDHDATITKVIAYGGMYNWSGEPNLTLFNLYWYYDGGCCPVDLIDSAMGVTPEQAFLGYDGWGYPTYKLEASVGVAVSGGSRYWLCFQAADHAFPPQWGRQGTGGIVRGCPSMFQSAFFGCPTWDPAGDLIGAPWDAAQELECGGATPTKRVSWGAIRGLFR